MLEGKKQRVVLNDKFSKDHHHHPKYVYKIINPKEVLATPRRNLCILMKSSVNT